MKLTYIEKAAIENTVQSYIDYVVSTNPIGAMEKATFEIKTETEQKLSSLANVALYNMTCLLFKSNNADTDIVYNLLSGNWTTPQDVIDYIESH